MDSYYLHAPLVSAGVCRLREEVLHDPAFRAALGFVAGKRDAMRLPFTYSELLFTLHLHGPQSPSTMAKSNGPTSPSPLRSAGWRGVVTARSPYSLSTVQSQ